jgi:voltage-dependent calcium channel T type alpha-1I
LEGELTIIDNLSGSIFHHYSSPAGCDKCHHDKQEVLTAWEEELWALRQSPGGSEVLGEAMALGS